MDHMKKDDNRVPYDSFGVYRSPEFKAFCERFGIAWGLRTKSLTIHLPDEGEMVVTHEYATTVSKDDPEFGTKSKFIDTTTGHNEKFRTAIPAAKRD